MNGQHHCCAIGLCCRKKENRVQALAELIEHHHALMETQGELYHDAAQVVLDLFDLVPKGLGEQIIAAYEPLFAERDKRPGGPREEP